MSSVIFLLPFLVTTVTAATHSFTEAPGARCHQRGESPTGAVRVLEGEAAWVRCPLFQQPSLHNHSRPRDLTWKRLLPGRRLQQPIADNVRLSKERDALYLEPALPEDSGRYVCLLRKQRWCAKTWVRVTVVGGPRAAPEDQGCPRPPAAAPAQVDVPLQGDALLDCPDRREAARVADGEPVVTWYHGCERAGEWTSDREQAGPRLQLHYMVDHYQGLYVCHVRYRRAGRELGFTRAINVTAVSPPFLPKEPFVLQPAAEAVTPVKPGSDVRLLCRGRFPYLGRHSDWDIWWSVDGTRAERLARTRFSVSNRRVSSKYGDRIEESVLLVRDFASDDLAKTYNCSVRNRRGFHTRTAHLREEASAPSLELACGLSAVPAVSLVLLALCRVFRLELLLLYRSWFGTDERHADDKEFDVYISYARNSEEEKFVLRTLRGVLENHLGYTVCIFDRDSLPGGTITDETLSFVARSRRLVVVLGPGYARRGSQALLELKAGVDGLAGGHLRLILLQYKRVRRQEWVRELRRARVALATVRWRGEPSRDLTSRFWKKLRLELPVRRMPAARRDEESAEEAGLKSAARPLPPRLHR